MASSVREHVREEATETDETEGCPECGGETAADGQETVCQDCGLVVETDEIDHGPEWRAFDEDQRDAKRRTGPARNPTLHDHGLGSEIGFDGPRDADMNRLRRWHQRMRCQGSNDQTLKDGLSQIARIVSAVDAPQVVKDRACTLFREAHDEGVFVGQCLDAGAMAAVYAAARECRIGLTFDDVRAVGHTQMNPWTTLLSMQRGLGLELPPPRPEDCMPRLLNRLGVDDATEAEARDVLETFTDGCSLSGLDPSGVCAMAIYVASDRTRGHKLTQERIADAADVSTVTLRKRLRDFEEVSDE